MKIVIAQLTREKRNAFLCSFFLLLPWLLLLFFYELLRNFHDVFIACVNEALKSIMNGKKS